MLLRQAVEKSVCDILDIPWPTMTVTADVDTYQDNGSLGPQQHFEIDYSAKVNELVNTLLQKIPMGMKFNTVLPLFGGGVPGPVSGVEIPLSSWIVVIDSTPVP